MTDHRQRQRLARDPAQVHALLAGPVAYAKFLIERFAKSPPSPGKARVATEASRSLVQALMKTHGLKTLPVRTARHWFLKTLLYVRDVAASCPHLKHCPVGATPWASFREDLEALKALHPEWAEEVDADIAFFRPLAAAIEFEDSMRLAWTVALGELRAMLAEAEEPSSRFRLHELIHEAEAQLSSLRPWDEPDPSSLVTMAVQGSA